jgi:hypothetical protein
MLRDRDVALARHSTEQAPADRLTAMGSSPPMASGRAHLWWHMIESIVPSDGSIAGVGSPFVAAS